MTFNANRPPQIQLLQRKEIETMKSLLNTKEEKNDREMMCPSL